MAQPARSKVLVTGAAGFIGSHTVMALTRAGYDVVALDDFSNSSRQVPGRLATLCPNPVEWIECDVRDAAGLATVMRAHAPASVIHFAGKKSVEESFRVPLAYYDVNVVGTMRLVEAMQECGVSRLVFSSSATVYDPTQVSPLDEGAMLRCLSPYGRSKRMAEEVIRDAAPASGGMQFALLRYFNPVGADESGTIGESPKGQPANLMPSICRVAAGLYSSLTVFGDDYPTPDGSGIRDYVHVSDVADAHVLALEKLGDAFQSAVINIGSGCGYSVFEVLRAFARANGVIVPMTVNARREGDAAQVFADTAAAQRLLGWRAEHDLERMCRDAWRWQKMNPNGYDP